MLNGIGLLLHAKNALKDTFSTVVGESALLLIITVNLSMDPSVLNATKVSN